LKKQYNNNLVDPGHDKQGNKIYSAPTLDMKGKMLDCDVAFRKMLFYDTNKIAGAKAGESEFA
jgi:hypothetical protein